MRAFAFSLVLVLACAACGCGTINNVVGAGTPPADPSVNIDPPNVIYGGVKQDAEFAATYLNPRAVLTGGAVAPAFTMLGAAFAVCAVVDLPLSFIGDTLTLPVTIPATVAKARLQHSNTPILRAEHTTDPTRK